MSPSIEVVAKQPVDRSVQHYLSINSNSKNQEIVSAPLSVPLSDLLLQTANSDKAKSMVYFLGSRL